LIHLTTCMSIDPGHVGDDRRIKLGPASVT
jgi:hypothetical protein